MKKLFITLALLFITVNVTNKIYASSTINKENGLGVEKTTKTEVYFTGSFDIKVGTENLIEAKDMPGSVPEWSIQWSVSSDSFRLVGVSPIGTLVYCNKVGETATLYATVMHYDTAVSQYQIQIKSVRK